MITVTFTAHALSVNYQCEKYEVFSRYMTVLFSLAFKIIFLQDSRCSSNAHDIFQLAAA